MIVVHPFTAEGEGELTVPQNTLLTLLEAESEQNPGWLLVKTQDGRTGYVPVDFLRQQQQDNNNNNNNGESESFKQKAASRMSIAMPPAMLVQQQQQQQQQYSPYGFEDNSFATAATSGLTAPPPPSAYGGQQQPTTWGQQPTVDAWAQRDTLYGPQIRTPIPAQRRWYYRDLFGDMQGPFNPAEMRQRVDAKHIQAETFCLIEVGAGAVQRYEEKKLRELFPGLDAAFLQPPALGGNRAFWFYLDDAKVEHGPFSSDQMRLWFDVEGYFGSRTMIREANAGSNFAPLKSYYPDPMICFLDGPAPGAMQKQQSFSEPPSFQIVDPFNTATARPQSSSQASSRQLLQAALAGGVPPPPAIGKAQQPIQAQLVGPPAAKGRDEDDEDDMLALFDQVGLMTEEERKKSQSQSVQPKALRIYGSPSVWPPWKGVPNFASSSRPDTFPTLLYHFFTRPLNPHAGKILCHITREIDGIGHFNYNKFVLYLENETGPQPTAVGIRHSGAMSTSFDIKLLTNGRVDDTKGALTIAKMECNFLGTQFLLHNAVPGHQGKAKDLCCVFYEANRMGKGGPRKMRVGIPDLEESKPEYKVFPHGATGTDSMATALQSINAKNLVPMLNKPPKWNEAKGAYSLDFGGRVTRASVKNFQLVDALHDPEHHNVILQHGRVAQDKFTMDVQHPMSLLQAFAVCLSSLDQKKGVD